MLVPTSVTCFQRLWAVLVASFMQIAGVRELPRAGDRDTLPSAEYGMQFSVVLCSAIRSWILSV